ncbi:uncharacterized protein F4822DRAFT_430812 [Hypoxylon trugodes]|uniref:uncharacterized protein n=1 Tax=Hypoxylon trugodes TaxID=326681 RepID=UPI00219BDA37|nr:uncharacterized protein F4822DRAFT_430812 [Hypoxylon trugodes]KAI1388057.1 hypothetical protein F4822DRAFT_430812 [Hypoxylon trugodes]
MTRIPPETLMIPRYGGRRILQARMPEVGAWIVDSKLDGKVPFKLWMKPEVYDDLSKIYPSIPEVEDLARGGGFLHGRPLLEKEVEIETCWATRQPKRLYRIIHDGQPFGGIKSRGFEDIHINPVHFQVLVQKHLNWNCRNPSPFLSVTDDLKKVKVVAAVFQARGHTGIQILELDPKHPAWDHKVQKVWNARDLIDTFGTPILKRRRFLENEYLVEKSISPESITGRFKWKEARRKLDPIGFMQNLMARRVVNQKHKKREREREARRAKESKLKEGKGVEDRDNMKVARKRNGLKRTTEFKLRL